MQWAKPSPSGLLATPRRGFMSSPFRLKPGSTQPDVGATEPDRGHRVTGPDLAGEAGDPLASIRPRPPVPWNEWLKSRLGPQVGTMALRLDRDGRRDLDGDPIDLFQPPGRRLRTIAGWALALLVLVAVGWWLLRPPPAPVETVLPSADGAQVADADDGVGELDHPVTNSAPGEQTASSPSESGSVDPVSTVPQPDVVVHASGAVAQPGVYRLPAGSRVDDVMRVAGGTTSDADTNRVNLAALVSDGERVWFPRVGEEIPAVVAGQPGVSPDASRPSGSSGPGNGTQPAGPVNINIATAEQLDSLPGIGPATSAAILAYREANGPFGSVDDLLEVRGIGEAKLEQLRPLVGV